MFLRTAPALAVVVVMTKCSSANRAAVPLEVIEVQSGSYLGEDDIVRFDDEYGREETPT